MAIIGFFVIILGFICLGFGVFISFMWINAAFASLYQAVLEEKGEDVIPVVENGKILINCNYLVSWFAWSKVVKENFISCSRHFCSLQSLQELIKLLFIFVLKNLNLELCQDTVNGLRLSGKKEQLMLKEVRCLQG